MRVSLDHPASGQLQSVRISSACSVHATLGASRGWITIRKQSTSPPIRPNRRSGSCQVPATVVVKWACAKSEKCPPSLSPPKSVVLREAHSTSHQESHPAYFSHTIFNFLFPPYLNYFKIRISCLFQPRCYTLNRRCIPYPNPQPSCPRTTPLTPRLKSVLYQFISVVSLRTSNGSVC